MLMETQPPLLPLLLLRVRTSCRFTVKMLNVHSSAGPSSFSRMDWGLGLGKAWPSSTCRVPFTATGLPAPTVVGVAVGVLPAGGGLALGVALTTGLLVGVAVAVEPGGTWVKLRVAVGVAVGVALGSMV